MDIARERLEREFGLELILTAPSVSYAVFGTDGSVKQISNPSDMPQPHFIAHIEEPAVNATIMVPQEYVGAVMNLCKTKRGIFRKMEYPSPTRVMLYYTLPLAEIVMDFTISSSRARGATRVLITNSQIIYGLIWSKSISC